METLFKDIKYAVRMLVRKPGFSVVAIVTLGLGIGANTAIFSLVNGILLRSLPYKSAERLVWIWGTNPKNDIEHETASLPDYHDWKTQSQSFRQWRAGALCRGLCDRRIL